MSDEKTFLYISTKKDIKDAVDYFNQQTCIGLDTETTAFEPRDGELSLIQLSNGKATVVIDCFYLVENEGFTGKTRQEKWELYEDLKTLLENPAVRKVVHNFKFEHKWLSECCGIETNPVFDTFIAAQLIDYNEENDPTRRHNLAAVAKRWLDVDVDKTEQISDWSVRPLSDEQLEYAALDPYYLPELREVLLQELIDGDLLRAAKIEFDATPTVAEMEMAGIKVNRELYKEEIRHLVALQEESGKKLQGEVKEESVVQGNLFGEPEKDFGAINLASKNQMVTALAKHGVPVFDKSQVAKYEKFFSEKKMIESMGSMDRLRYMKTHFPKFNMAEYKRFEQAKKEKKEIIAGTGAKALKHITSQYDVLKLLSDFRSAEKMVTSFGENFLEWLKPSGDHERVYPSFFQIGAPTGRFACRYPNVQQIPHGSIKVGDEEYKLGFRKAFDFPEGKVGILADYSAIELRIAAHMSGDKVMIEAISSGQDLHSLTASKMFDIPYECLLESHPEYSTKYWEYRYKAKACNFGLIYGAGAYTMADTLNTTKEEAQVFIDLYAKTYPVLWEFLNNQAKKAVNTLSARTMSGRRQLFNEPNKELNPYTQRMEYVRKEASAIGRNGKNMPIQGCLTSDARILIQDKGYVRIGETEKQRENVWDGEKFVGAFVTNSGKKQLTKVNFVGGNSINCSPIHKFQAYTRGVGYEWVEAQHLNRTHRVFITDNTPEFDFADFSSYNVLHRITSYEIGTLLALYHKFGGYDNDLLMIDILESRFPLKEELEEIFKNLGLVFDNDTIIHNKGRLDTRYIVDSKELIEDLERLSLANGFTEEFWTSKQVIRGFLRVIFNYADKYENTFKISSKNKNLIKDIQQGLFLFGLTSTRSSGLLTNYLTVTGKNLHNFLMKVGIVEEELCLQAVTLKQLQRIRKFKYYGADYLKVDSVELTDQFVEMYDVADSDTHKFVANGLITHNTSADILKRALKLLRDTIRAKGYRARVVNIVHDEVIVESDIEDAEEVRVDLEKCMTEAGEEYITKVPIKVDAKIVSSWGEKN